jgi:hypothetical protein
MPLVKLNRKISLRIMFDELGEQMHADSLVAGFEA